MPFGSPVSDELQGSSYDLLLTHNQDTTISIFVSIPSTGDSGGDSSDGDVIAQAIVDLFESDPDFTIVSATKKYGTNVEITPTP